jgi:hypothetical protein
MFQNCWARDIVGVLTMQVLCQYLQVWQLMCVVDLNPLQADCFCVEMVSGWEILRVVDLPCLIRQIDIAPRGQRALEDKGAAQSQIILLASPTSQALDCKTSQKAWSSRL